VEVIYGAYGAQEAEHGVHSAQTKDEQMPARSIHTGGVAGSIPASPTIQPIENKRRSKKWLHKCGARKGSGQVQRSFECERIPDLTEKDRERFSYFVPSGDADSCWEWQAGKTAAGYGGVTAEDEASDAMVMAVTGEGGSNAGR
jgi:hypothetical protein